MARKPQGKNGGVSKPNVKDNNNLYKAAILKVDSQGKIDAENGLSPFLLNPSTLEESKASNWVTQSIPGQSDPILQWLSGGPRTLSFQALVTKDTSYFMKEDPSLLGAAINKATNIIGSIASNFAGVNLPPLGDLIGSLDSGNGNDLSIAEYLNFYRSLLYPVYENGKLISSPSLLVLAFGNSLSSSITMTDNVIAKHTEVWVLADLKIAVTKQLPNLNPMEATVDFKFIQYPFYSYGTDHFISGDPYKATVGLDPISSLLF